MDFKVRKEYTVVLDEQEAAALAGDLFNIKMGYRGGSSGAGRELLNWLGSRNEETPSGKDGKPDKNAQEEW
jgi:hypothetical protein